jgi:S1-C subfamily serine protease
VGGLVWTVFTESLVLQAQLMKDVYIPPATTASALHRWREREDEEVVVFLRALEHPCNKWYHLSAVRVLRFVNGEKVINMKQFVTEVGKILSRGDHLRFTFESLDDDDAAGSENDPDVVLDTKLCIGADKSLMLTHQIPTPASMNLRDAYGTIPRTFSQFEFPRQAPTGQQPKKSEEVAMYQAARKGRSIQSHAQKNANETELQLRQLPWANVVQIRLVAAEADFLSPWKSMPPGSSRCSAVIVDKARRLIMTNSHCGVSGVAVDILREDAPIPVPARVIEIARDVDLAMITTDDDAFWANENIRETISMAEVLPYISHSVRVVGYPTGGSSITITQGIVSRVDGQLYPNGLVPGARNTPDALVIVQIDAAINPGNSGGPVFDSRGNLVGLAFAGIGAFQSVGYVIPNIYLKNFISSVSSSSTGHRWRAQPEIGAEFRTIENPGIRKFLSLEESETGVQVRTVSPYSPLAKHGIAKGDVLLRVDGLRVQGNGKIVRDLNGNEITLPLETKITEKAFNETTKLEFLHYEEGRRIKKVVEDIFGPVPPLVPRFYDAPVPVEGRAHFAAQPTYYILWGLVWGVFSNPVLHQAMSRKVEVPWSVRKDAMHRWLQNDSEEVVVLLQGLGHPCTLYYDVSTMRILEYFNGRKVNSMRDLVTYALEADLMQEEYMRITFKPLADKDLAGSVTDPDIVLHRSMCSSADKQIMQSYNIASQGSPDVAQYFNDAKAAAAKKFGNSQNPAGSSLFQSDQEAIEFTQAASFGTPGQKHDPYSFSLVDPKPVGAAQDMVDHDGIHMEMSLPIVSDEPSQMRHSKSGNGFELEPSALVEVEQVQQSRKLRRQRP